MNAELQKVTPDISSNDLAVIMDLVERGLEYTEGREDWRSLYEKMLNGTHQWWLLTSGKDILGIIITLVKLDNETTVIRYALTVGEAVIGNAEMITDRINEWAKREFGATQAELFGRRGWEKVFPGWRKHVFLVKDL